MAGKSDEFEQISAYLDGELSEEKRHEIEQWLEQDPKARQILDDLRRVSGLVASLPRESGPTDLAFTIRSQVERDALLDDTRPKRRVRRVRAVGWATRLGAVAVVIIGATLAWFSVEQTQTPIAKIAATTSQGADQDASNSADEDAPANAVRRPRAMARGVEQHRKDKTLVSAEAASAEERSARAHRGRRSRPANADDNRLRPKRAPAAGDGTPEQLAFARREYTPLPGGRVLNGAAIGKNEFDVRLRENVLTQADLRNDLNISPANRIVVETDLRSAKAMVQVINGFMASNGIPAADSDDVPDPISAEQVFFFNQAAGLEHAEEEAVDNEPDVFVMNVYPQQAELLFVSIDSFATLNRSEVEWHANWVHDKEPQPLDEIIQSINTDLSEPPDVAGDAEHGGTTRAEATPAVEELDASQDDKNAGGAAFGKKPRYASPRVQDDAPITFAVEIRARKKPGADRFLQFPPVPPTSQPTERATTATQPASQRSEGG